MPKRRLLRDIVLAGLAGLLPSLACNQPEQPRFRTITSDGGGPSWRREADRLRQNGQFDQLIDLLRNQLAETVNDPHADAEARMELGRAYWDRNGRVAGADADAESRDADRNASLKHLRDAMTTLEALEKGKQDPLYGRAVRLLGKFLRTAGRADEAIALYEQLLQSGSDNTEQRVRTLHELGNAYLDRAGRRGEEPATRATLDEDIGLAQRTQNEALALAKGDADCPPVLQAYIHNSLGLIAREQTQPAIAAEQFADAERLCPESDEAGMRTEILANLVAALVEAGRYDELARRAAELGDSPDAASNPRILAVLGLAELKRGAFNDAIEHFDLARHLARQDPSCVADANFMAQLVSNAAAAAQEVGAFAEAERYLSEARHDLEGGGVDPRTAAVVQANLGRLYLTVERLDDADRQLTEALATFRRLLGEDHPDTLLLHLDLANLSRLRGFEAEAMEHCETALRGLVALKGETNVYVARARMELAALLREQGRCSAAIAQTRQALATFDELLGPEHKDSVRACLEAALVAADCRATPEGEAAFAELQAEAGRRFAAMREALGPQNLEVLRAMVYFAGVTAQTPTAYETALARYREAEEGFRPLYGDGAPTLAALRLKEGELLEKMGRMDEALAAYDQALRLLDRQLDRHPVRAELLTAMGDLLADVGQRERAAPLWEEAARILAAIYGPDHPRVQRLRDKLRS